MAANSALVRSLVVTACLLTLGIAGCGFIPQQGSCDGRAETGVCADLLSNRDSHLHPTISGYCDLQGGTWSDGLCDRDGALGGCLTEEGQFGRTVHWYFPGATTGDDDDNDAAPPAGDAGVGEGEGEGEGEVPAVLNTVEDVQAYCESQNRPFVDPSVASP